MEHHRQSNLTKIEEITLVDVLLDRAKRQGTKTAFRFLSQAAGREQVLTFAELDRQTRRVAVELAQHGAPGEPVLLLYPPGLHYVTAFLACLYAGMVAVPLYPPRRNQRFYRVSKVLHDSRARIALTCTDSLPAIKAFLAADKAFHHIHVMATDKLPSQDSSWQRPQLGSADLAFLQYTSGTTDSPRGVMVSHGNIMANQQTMVAAGECTEHDVFVSWLPLYHDMGLIGTVLQTVYRGFTAVLLPSVSFVGDPLWWLEVISHYRGTISGGPNFGYDLCCERASDQRLARLDLSSWRLAFLGAEPVRAGTLRRFGEVFAVAGFHRKAFYPCYGMAEATLFISGGNVHEPPTIRTYLRQDLEQDRATPTEHELGISLVSCGTTHLTDSLTIVNPNTRRALEAGIVGEIWVQSSGITCGYWHRPEETERKFAAHLADSDEGPYLRTGDLGFIDDGELYITGRLKDLIILQGRNSYPQDLERCAQRSHPALSPDDGAAFTATAEGCERLILLLEVKRTWVRKIEQGLESICKAIRAAISDSYELQVHEIMLLKPGRILKTSSGKVQRFACKTSYEAGTMVAIATHSLPTDSLEFILPNLDRQALLAAADPHTLLVPHLHALLAASLSLAVDTFDKDTPFTQLGISSMAAISLQHACEIEWGIKLDIEHFISGGSLSQLAEACWMSLCDDEHQQVVSSPPKCFAATPNQTGLWQAWRLDPQSLAYNLPFAVRFSQDLEVTALKTGLGLLLHRHRMLRAVFEDDGRHIQIHINERLDLPFRLHQTNSEESMHKLLLEVARTPFDLRAGPLLRFDLLCCGEQDFVLLINIHQIVGDMWSLLVLVDELSLLYANRGEHALLEPAHLDFADFAAEACAFPKSKRGQQQSTYWTNQLAQPPVLELQTDFPRSAQKTSKGASWCFQIDNDTVSAVHQLATSSGNTRFTLFLAAFQVLMHHYSGQNDILVITPHNGRGKGAYRNLVGHFVNPLAIRSRLIGRPNFPAFLTQTRTNLRAAMTHAEYPFQAILEGLAPQWEPSHSSLFQIFFVYQEPHRIAGAGAFALRQQGAQLELGELLASSIALDSGSSQLDLSLFVAETDTGLTAVLEYNSGLFEESTIKGIARHWYELLQAIISNPDGYLDEIMPHRESELSWGSSVDASEHEQQPKIVVSAPARNDIESTLCHLWQQLLGRENVGIHDNFFELGGNSISAIQIINLARRELLEIEYGDFFNHPTIAELAPHAKQRAVLFGTELVPGPVLPSPIQHSFLSAGSRAATHFNQAILLTIDASIDPLSVYKGLALLHEHHDGLRLRFGAKKILHDTEAPFLFEIFAASQGEALQKTVLRETTRLQTSFDLEHGPLLATALFLRPGSKANLLFLTIHQLVADDASWRILLEDLTSLLGAFRLDEKPVLPPKTTSFSHWSMRIRQCKSRLSYWLDWPKTVRTATGAESCHPAADLQTEKLERSLDPELTSALFQLPAVYRMGVRELLLTALARALAQESGHWDMTLDTESHGRDPMFNGVDLSRTVGWFSAVYPIRLALTSEAQACDDLVAVKEQLSLIPNGGVLFGLERFVRQHPALVTLPERRVLFKFRDSFDSLQVPFLTRSERAIGPKRSPLHKSAYPLEVHAELLDDRLQLRFIYSTGQYERASIESLARRIQQRIKTLLTHCKTVTSQRFTPSDFPHVEISSASLDSLLASCPELKDLYPLAPTQTALLIHALYFTSSPAYHEQVTFRFKGELNMPIFLRAWLEVLRNNPVLATSFRWENLGQPLQQVDAGAEPQWLMVDLRGHESPEIVLAAYLSNDRKRGFALDRAPLTRYALFQSQDHTTFIWSYHQLLLDGWSHGLVLEEVFATYRALCDRQTPAVIKRTPYRQFITTTIERDQSKANQYWREQLSGFEAALVLPIESGQKSEIVAYEECVLSQAALANLKRLGQTEGLTLATCIQAVWSLILAHYCCTNDVVFGLTVSGREGSLTDITTVVGQLTNNVPVRVRLMPEQHLGSWLKHIQQDGEARAQHAATPLTHILGLSQLPGRTALFDSLVVMDPFPFNWTKLEQGVGLTLEEVQTNSSTPYGLTLMAHTHRGLRFQLAYDAARFELASVRRLLNQLETLLSTMPQYLGCSLQELLLHKLEDQPATKQNIESHTEQGPVLGTFPLSPVQHAFFERGGNPHFNQAALLTVPAELDPQVLQKVLNQLTDHHDSLRLRFSQDEQGRWQQNLAEPGMVVPLQVHQWTSPKQDWSANIEERVVAVSAGFNLTHGPLIRALFLHMQQVNEEAQARLLLVAHHLVIDTYSWTFLLEDLRTACQQGPVRFPAKTNSFKAWCQRLNEYALSEELVAEADYWLSQAEAQPLPCEEPIESKHHKTGSTRQVNKTLDKENTQKLLRQRHSSIEEILLTALACAWRRWSKRQELVVELEAHGRGLLIEDLNFARTTGWFTTTYPMQLDVPASQTPDESLVSIKRQLRGVPHGGVGYDLLRYLNPSHKPALAARTAPCICFKYQVQNPRRANQTIFPFAEGTSGITHDPSMKPAHPIEVKVTVLDGRLQLQWIWSPDLIKESRIIALVSAFDQDLHELINQCLGPEPGAQLRGAEFHVTGN